MNQETFKIRPLPVNSISNRIPIASCVGRPGRGDDECERIKGRGADSEFCWSLRCVPNTAAAHLHCQSPPPRSFFAQSTNDNYHPQPPLVYSESWRFVSGPGNIILHLPRCVLNGVFRNVTRHSSKTLTSAMLSVSGIRCPRDLESESSQEDPL